MIVRRRRWMLWVLLATGCTPAVEGPVSVAIQPFQGATPEEIEAVKAEIADQYNVTLEVLPEKPLPDSAYYPARNRHRADALLNYLDEVSAYTRVVGVAAGDISATKGFTRDWGIFGLGTINGRSCVLSGFRLQREKVGRARYLERLRRVAVHELGHTFGLQHCTTGGCLMRDMAGKVVTLDASDGRFCERCAMLLRRRSLVRSPMK